MRHPPETLEEARQRKLAQGRRADIQERLVAGVGLLTLLVAGVVLTGAVYGQTLPVGKADLAAGNAGRAFLLDWNEAPVAFRRALPKGPTVEARTTLPALEAPSGTEFRLDGQTVGTVVGGLAEPVDLKATRVARAGGKIVISLPMGYWALRPGGRTGPWAVEFQTAR